MNSDADRPNILLWYNPETDQLALAGEGWEYLVSIAFVPFVRTKNPRTFDDGGDPRINYAAKEVAFAKTDVWVSLGAF